MRKYRAAVGVLLIIVLSAGLFRGAERPSAVMADVQDAQEKEGSRGNLRVGYCQESDYYEYDYELFWIGMGLTGLGEIRSQQLSGMSQGAAAEDVWDVLCTAESGNFTFIQEGFFDLSRGDFLDLSEEEAQNLLAEKIEEYDIDLMITMGTTAGLAVRDCSDVPYMNFIASDPVGVGISGGVEFSGNGRAWAHVNTGVEERALTVMQDIFGPEKIGIVYNNTPTAYVYSGAASVDEFADANGLDVVKEYVSDDFDDTGEAYENYRNELLSAHKKLAESGIGVYILTTTLLNPEDYRESLRPFIEKGIPVFSINSTEDVRFGALAAVEMYDYENIGRFAADNMAAYHAGAELSELPQVYITPPFLVLNIDTMRETKITMTLEALISASKIYNQYQGE